MPLVVSVGANLQDFQKGMDEAGNLATKAVGEIEKAFASSNPSIVPALDKVSSEAGIAGKAIGLLLGGGIAAGLGAALEFINQMNDQMRELEVSAKRAGISLAEFQRLRFAAGSGGVSDKDFAKGAEELAHRLQDATRNANELSKFLEANNIKFKEGSKLTLDVAGALDKARDAIQRTPNYADKIEIAKIFGLTKEWVEALSQTSSEFESSKQKADELGIVIDDATIKKAAQFSREWRASTLEWTAFFQAQLAGLFPLANELINRLTNVPESVQRRTADLVVNKPAEEIDKITASIASLINAILGADSASDALGRLDKALEKIIATGGNVASDTSGINKRINEVFSDIPGARPRIPFGPDIPAGFNGPPPIIPAKSTSETASAFDREIERIQRHTAAMQADAVSVGLTAGRHEELRAQLLLLNANFKDANEEVRNQIQEFAKLRAEGKSVDEAIAGAGISIDSKLVEKLKNVPAAAGAAADALFKTRQAFQGLNSALQFAGNEIVGALDGILTRTKTFGDAFKDIMGSVRRALLQALIFGGGPLANILGLGTAVPGGTGGILGALFSKKAGGGTVYGDQPYIVGERGPELFVPGSTGTVYPNDVTRSMGGGGFTVSPVYNIDASGADSAAIARLERALLQLNSSIESRARRTYYEDRRRRL